MSERRRGAREGGDDTTDRRARGLKLGDRPPGGGPGRAAEGGSEGRVDGGRVCALAARSNSQVHVQ